MTKSEFEKSLKRGRGKCVIELKNESEQVRFKDLVLKACTADFSYDIQVEGPRSRYVYDMVCQYKNRDCFINETLSAFELLSENNIDDFNHIVNLIAYFAIDGNQDCKNALVDKYKKLFSFILDKRPTKNYNFMRDCFEYTAIALTNVGDENTIARIISDVGKIFTNNKYYTFFDFLWLYDHAEVLLGKKTLKTLLNKKAKSCAYTAKYVEKLELYNQENQKDLTVETPQKINYANLIIEEVKKNKAVSVANRVIFQKRASQAEKERVLRYGLKEIKTVRKVAYLSVFSKEPEFIPVNCLLEYAKNDSIPLRNFAIGYLINYRSPEVRDFAYRNIYNTGKKNIDFLKMLITNYQPEDADFFEFAFATDNTNHYTMEEYHDIGMHVLKYYERQKLPKECILFVYENTPCPYCRNKAVNYIYKNKKLFNQIVNECVFDSYADTVSLAKKYLKNNQ